jgi:hypothetical protein
MDLSNVSLTGTEARALMKLAAQRLAEVERLTEKYGEEPQRDGAVVRFTKHFPARRWDITPLSQRAATDFMPKTYVYAAIRAGAKWWTTGPKSSGGYDWDDLLAFIDTGATGNEKLEVLSPGYDTVAGEIVTTATSERHPSYDPEDDDPTLTGKVLDRDE